MVGCGRRHRGESRDTLDNRLLHATHGGRTARTRRDLGDGPAVRSSSTGVRRCSIRSYRAAQLPGRARRRPGPTRRRRLVAASTSRRRRSTHADVVGDGHGAEILGFGVRHKRSTLLLWGVRRLSAPVGLQTRAGIMGAARAIQTSAWRRRSLTSAYGPTTEPRSPS